MDSALRKALGQRLTDDAILMGLLKSGASSVYYGINPRIDAKNSVPFIRFFFFASTTDDGLIRPHEKQEIRVQIDAVAESESTCELIVQRIQKILCIPGSNPDPIKTTDWRVDQLWMTNASSIDSGIDIDGGGKSIQVIATDWTMIALRLG